MNYWKDYTQQIKYLRDNFGFEKVWSTAQKFKESRENAKNSTRTCQFLELPRDKKMDF